ncbi:Calcineurin-like phosphoesterase [Gracilaria domingensis]|nr:Calcineurin-like phosphoesterase [Gracilaria domingensis]
MLTNGRRARQSGLSEYSTMSIERAQDRASSYFRDRSMQQWLSAHSTALRIVGLVAVLSVFAAVFAVDSSLSSAHRKYARAASWLSKANLGVVKSDECDAALGRRRLWVFEHVVGNEMCVLHSQKRRLIAPESGLRFQVVGDWGRDGMCCQRDVALEMASFARVSKPRFIVSVGDNFYDNGILSADDGQINRSWRDVYLKHEELKLPWKMTVGNHDYNGNVSAQEVLGRDDVFWQMRKRYYFDSYHDEGNSVLIAYLDTTVMYYTDEQLSMFREQVGHDFRKEQIAQLRSALNESSAKWKIVIGHHPLQSSGENSITEDENLQQMRKLLLNTLNEFKVSAYFSGHEHLMEHMVLGDMHAFISGAGSKISSVLRDREESVFAVDRQGFLDVVIRNDSDVMKVHFVDLNGAILHQALIPPRTSVARR